MSTLFFYCENISSVFGLMGHLETLVSSLAKPNASGHPKLIKIILSVQFHAVRILKLTFEIGLI